MQKEDKIRYDFYRKTPYTPAGTQSPDPIHASHSPRMHPLLLVCL